MRTARARTSGEYRAEVFVMAPPSQGLEPPANPARFKLCNVKKHAALVPVSLAKPFFAIRPTKIETRGDMLVSEICGPITLGGAFDAEKNEITVLRFPKGKQPDAETQVTYAIVLRHPEKVISGQHPIFLLDAIRSEVERILADTEAECRRIGVFT